MKNISPLQKQIKKNKNKKQLDDYLNEFHHSVIDSYVLLFSEEDFDCGFYIFKSLLRYKISMPKIGRTSMRYWVSRGWSEEESKIKMVKIKRDPTTSPMNLDFWIKRGKTKKEAEFAVKSQRKMNKEYWMKRGYSEEESIKESIKFQKSSNKSYIDKYKSDDIFRKNVNEKRPNNINYWLNKGYSEEESKELQSNRQRTFSLEICVDKHGEEKGIKIWRYRQEKWNKSLLENGNLKVGYSNISQILFDSICDELKKCEFIFYGKKNKELSISDGKSGFLYDFTDLFNKKIIEFNGDIYHGNPSIYSEYDKPNPFKDLTAKDLWRRDRIKTELAESHGFEVLTIWESEYKSDRIGILNKCLEFIRNK